MRISLLILSVLFSFKAFATGGFECTDKSNGKLVAFGTTARVVGNPLIALTIIEDKNETSYSRDQIVGYWNMGPELKVAVSDADYMFLDYVLETVEVTPRINEDVTEGTLKNRHGVVVEVECLY
jgi:hypothetical protein